MKFFLPKHFLFFLSSVTILIASFGFNAKEPQNKELMTLVVTYENGVQYLVQSNSDGTCTKEAFIATNARQRLKHYYKTPGTAYQELPLKNRYDNTAILAKVKLLGTEGWQLLSHDYSMAIGDTLDAPFNKERVSFYLFER